MIEGLASRMLGVGGTELFIIIVVAFILFGPDKLPQIGRTIGRAIRQFQTAQDEVTKVVKAQVYDPLNDKEPISSIEDLFKDKKKESSSTQAAKADASTAKSDAANTSASSGSKTESAGALPGGTRKTPTHFEPASKPKPQKTETFAQKRARLQREHNEAVKNADPSATTADRLYSVATGGTAASTTPPAATATSASSQDATQDTAPDMTQEEA